MNAAYGRGPGDYVAVLRRRKLVFALGLLLGLALGLGYLAVAEKTYVSTAKVLVLGAASDSSREGSRTTDSINLDTEAQIVTSFGVAEAAQDRLDSDLSLPALARRVTVTVPPNTTVLEIAYRASDAAQAQAGAQAFAEAYLDSRLEAARSVTQTQTSNIEDDIAATSAELATLSAELENETAPGEVAQLRAQRAVLTTRIESLNTRLAGLQSAVVRTGQVINDAQRPSSATAPNPMLVIPAALFGGLILGLALALWRDSRDPRLHTTGDLHRLFGLTPVADLKSVTVQLREGRTRQLDASALYHSLRAAGAPGRQVVAAFAPDAPDVGQAACRALADAAARTGVSALHLYRESLGQLSSPLVAPGTLVTASYADHGMRAEGGLDAGRFHEAIAGVTKDYDFTVMELPVEDAAVGLPLTSRCVDRAVMVVCLGVSTRRSIEQSLRIVQAANETDVLVATVGRSAGRKVTSRRSQRSNRTSADVDTGSAGESAHPSDSRSPSHGGGASGSPSNRP
jgi:capsular polysaccharide biosynthesis protein